MKRILIMAMVVFLSAVVAVSAQPHQPSKPSKKDKCPVCGMFVYKYPDWTAQIIFKDGTTAFFDGSKDLFKYYLNLKKYEPGRKVEDIAAVYVSEYYDLKMIDATQAYYVIGSDVYGPMGHELIPLATQKDAEGFMADHKGLGIMRFQDISLKVIEKLD